MMVKVLSLSQWAQVSCRYLQRMTSIPHCMTESALFALQQSTNVCICAAQTAQYIKGLLKHVRDTYLCLRCKKEIQHSGIK